MPFTPYHAKYFACELTKRSASDSMQKLAATLVDAQVDLNPHQVEAALFAFRSPLSKGAILADEVGLGKTIEAGLVISQKWAERKRKILIITPANLRKQWSQELQEKFFLPSFILEAKSFNDTIKSGNLNPFDRSEIVLCSYQFARSKEPYLRQVRWDLAVIDEAHRLRNVYKPGNKIARSIKDSLEEAPKILLTATPLQNSLQELYGLVSIIDEYAFGDLKSFKSQYSRANNTPDEDHLLLAGIADTGEPLDAKQCSHLFSQYAEQGAETDRDNAWRAYDAAAKEIERAKEQLIDQVEKQLELSVDTSELFLLRWKIQ